MKNTLLGFVAVILMVTAGEVDFLPSLPLYFIGGFIIGRLAGKCDICERNHP